MSCNTTQDTLRTPFAEYGRVALVNVFTIRDTGRPRGFAYAEMSTEEAAWQVMSGLNGKQVVVQRESARARMLAARRSG